jgi:hypothetical protein
MPNWTKCRNFECRIELNAEFLNVLRLGAYMVDFHVQVEMYGGRDDTLSGIGTG